jgi:hypothetical protein
MIRRILLALALAMAVSHAACGADNGTTDVPRTEPPAETSPKRVESMKIRITISDLPRKLTKEGAPSGSDPSVGDITYYSPWGNLAIFNRDSGYAGGLIILGKIDSGVEALNVPGSLRVTVELIK